MKRIYCISLVAAFTSLCVVSQAQDQPTMRARIPDAPSAIQSTMLSIAVRQQPEAMQATAIPIQGRDAVAQAGTSNKALGTATQSSGAPASPAAPENQVASLPRQQSVVESHAGSTSVTGGAFIPVNLAMYVSTVANAETLNGCTNCTAVSAALHRRIVLYGAGLPIAGGFTYFGYRMKKAGNRWWFMPEVMATAANTFLAYHWESRHR